MDLTKLSNQLIKHEGLKQFPYRDTVGKLTIGVGHNLDDKGLTQAQIRSILIDDLTDTVNFLNFKLPWLKDLDDVRQRAVANMTFDLMGKILDFKHMLAALQAKDWIKASDELLNSTFAKQTGQRARDLAKMLLTGQDI